MSPLTWILLCTMSCVFAFNNHPRSSMRNRNSGSNIGWYRGDPQMTWSPYKVPERQQERIPDGQPDDYDQISWEELLDELARYRDNGQEETIGDGFQNRRLQLQSLKELAEQSHNEPSNFRERERSRDQQEDAMEQLMEEEAAESGPYGIPREIPEDPRDEYKLGMGELSRYKKWNDYYNQDAYYPALMSPMERRNVNGRYPLGRDFLSYMNREMVKRYPVAKRSPKPMTRERQATDPKVAKDLASLFGSQPTEGQNDVHQTTAVGEQNHTFNHADHTTAVPVSSVAPKTSKENQSTQSLKSKEHVIDVQKKNIDWSQYFGIDRRRKKAVLTAKPGSQNQDDAFFLQHYYSTMRDNLQSPKRNSEKDLEERMYKLQQLDSKLKKIKDFMIRKAILEGSQDTDDSDEVKESILNNLALAYSIQRLRQILGNMHVQGEVDFDKSEDIKHAGQEGIYPSVKKRLSMPYIS